MGKKDSKERLEIESFIEMTSRSSVTELVGYLNKHMEMKMFLVGQNITAADVVVHLYIASEFRGYTDAQKKELPHVFRWVDHVQHLPGMLEQVESQGLFVSFPSEKEEKLSKAQLKKLAKEQYKKDQKAQGGKPEEAKKADGNKEQKPK